MRDILLRIQIPSLWTGAFSNSSSFIHWNLFPLYVWSDSFVKFWIKWQKPEEVLTVWHWLFQHQPLRILCGWILHPDRLQGALRLNSPQDISIICKWPCYINIWCFVRIILFFVKKIWAIFSLITLYFMKYHEIFLCILPVVYIYIGLISTSSCMDIDYNRIIEYAISNLLTIAYICSLSSYLEYANKGLT